jgi:hypothetical protein
MAHPFLCILSECSLLAYATYMRATETGQQSARRHTQAAGLRTEANYMPQRPVLLPRVEAGSNTCTVALRVVKGDEKGTQCLGV